MKKLHHRWGKQVHFIDIIIRQAHPGPAAPPYRSIDDKLNHAQHYQHDEQLPWPVLVDDLQGSVHQVYGGLADPTYLIDRDGMVAFYNLWTYVPTLHLALLALLGRGGRGVVRGGWDRLPRLGPPLTDGWRGLSKGLPQSLIDIELAAPGLGISTWLGHQLRPLLAPLTLRSEPLPQQSAIRVATGAALLFLAVIWARRRRSRRTA